jgi:hypothetical protein
MTDELLANAILSQEVAVAREIQMQAMLRVSFRHDADLDRAYMHVNNQLSEAPR